MKKGMRPADSFTGPRPRGLLSLLFGRGEQASTDNGERRKAFEEVLRRVKRNFPVTEADHDRSGIFIKIIWDEEVGSSSFEKARVSLRELGFFPKLVDNGHETLLAIFPLPKKKKGKNTTNIILLILTLFTTIWAGATLWEERAGGLVNASSVFRVLIDPVDLGMGALTFALPLMLILGTHELGHYFTSRKYDVDASLPYFIPIPPVVSPFGTFGAMISMKEPISNRKALVAIGAAGPIAGFIVAIPVTIIGLILTGNYPSSPEMVEGMIYARINPPLLFRAIMAPLGISLEDDLFPTAIAGWIGLFVTSINLFPAGQLDGGHIARGSLGERGKFVSFLTVAVLLVLGIMTPFKTYLLFAFLILLMGSRHPPPLDDISKISPRHYLLAGVSLIIFALTFHPVPLEIEEAAVEGVDIVEAPDQLNISWNNVTTFDVVVENRGRLEKSVEIRFLIDNGSMTQDALLVDPEWNKTMFGPVREGASRMYSYNGWYLLSMDPGEMEIEGGEGKKLKWDLAMGCSRYKDRGEQVVLNIGFVTENEVLWKPVELECVNRGSP